MRSMQADGHSYYFRMVERGEIISLAAGTLSFKNALQGRVLERIGLCPECPYGLGANPCL